eukprot:361382-Chlamydomonas_euryale.AAC.5
MTTRATSPTCYMHHHQPQQQPSQQQQPLAACGRSGADDTSVPNDQAVSGAAASACGAGSGVSSRGKIHAQHEHSSSSRSRRGSSHSRCRSGAASHAVANARGAAAAPDPCSDLRCDSVADDECAQRAASLAGRCSGDRGSGSGSRGDWGVQGGTLARAAAAAAAATAAAAAAADAAAAAGAACRGSLGAMPAAAIAPGTSGSGLDRGSSAPSPSMARPRRHRADTELEAAATNDEAGLPVHAGAAHPAGLLLAACPHAKATTLQAVAAQPQLAQPEQEQEQEPHRLSRTSSLMATLRAAARSLGRAPSMPPVGMPCASPPATGTMPADACQLGWEDLPAHLVRALEIVACMCGAGHVWGNGCAHAGIGTIGAPGVSAQQ